MSKDHMEHPEGHSNWNPAPTTDGYRRASASDTNNTTTPHADTLPGAPVPSTAVASVSGSDAIQNDAPAATPAGDEEVLMGTPSVDPLGDAVAAHQKDMRIYSGAVAVHLALGVVLGWAWCLSGAEASDSTWGYVLRWSCMAWVAGFCVLVCVWSSARRELKRERRLMAEMYAAEVGLSSEDSALFVETVGEVS